MKKVSEIAFFKKIIQIREYQFGKFYFFDGIVISEINEGVTFGWHMAERAIEDTQKLFGEDMPIAYISNRVNDYYVVPKDWLKFFNHRHQLDYYCVVGKTKGSFASLVLEGVFFGKSIKKFSDLEAAIDWITLKLKTR